MTPSLGVSVGEEEGRVVVQRVVPGGPSDGKLLPGDVIEEMNGQPLTSPCELRERLRGTSRDKPVLLRIKRGEQSRYVAVQPRSSGP